MGIDLNYATIVDRTGKGGVDIVFDGQILTFKPGETIKPVPASLAAWLFRVDQHKVHTVDGEYVHRFGLKDASESLLRDIGVQDCSPIEIDTSRVEGWDTERYAPDRPDRMRTIPLKRNPADFANQATPGGYGTER
jgi:hypothetical protein